MFSSLQQGEKVLHCFACSQLDLSTISLWNTNLNLFCCPLTSLIIYYWGKLHLCRRRWALSSCLCSGGSKAARLHCWPDLLSLLPRAQWKRNFKKLTCSQRTVWMKSSAENVVFPFMQSTDDGKTVVTFSCQAASSSTCPAAFSLLTFFMLHTKWK